MASDYTRSPKDSTAYDAALENLLEEEPAELKALREAIRRNDQYTIRLKSKGLKSGLISLAKEEAISRGNTQALEILLDEDHFISDGLVSIACERKDCKSIRALIDYGWNINHPLHLGALPIALSVDDIEFMKWLIANGADVHSRSNLDQSALSTAIVKGSMEVVSFLLTQEKDLTRGNLLHCAAERKDQNEGAVLVETLVERGADVNAYRYNNPIALKKRAFSKLLTPLHVACHKQNVPVARKLLDFGADPDRKMLDALEKTGPTPLDVARKYCNSDLINLLTAKKIPEGSYVT